MSDTQALRRMVDAVDWGAQRGAMGPAHGFEEDLHGWLDGHGEPARVYNDVYHQGQVYPLAEPLVPILFAVLDADRPDLHASAMLWLSDAVGGVEGHTYQADGFDEWCSDWPPALRAVGAGVDRMLAAMERSNDEDVVAAGLSALAWLPAQAQPIGDWLAARLHRDPAGLAPLLAVVDWHRRSPARAATFAALLEGTDAEALAGAVSLARIRRSDPGVVARLLEGLRERAEVACHALTCRGWPDDDPREDVADAYLLTVFPAGGPQTERLSAAEHAALSELVATVPGPAEPAVSRWDTDPWWPEWALERFNLPTARDDLAAALAEGRRLHPVIGPADTGGRLHAPALAERRWTTLAWVGAHRVAVLTGADGWWAVSVRSLADGAETARLPGVTRADATPGSFATVHPSPEGRWVAVRAGGRITVWAADGGEGPRVLYDAGGGPWPHVAWSPDGRACALSHHDRLEVHPFDGGDVAATTIDGPAHGLAWTTAGIVTSRDFAAHVRPAALDAAPTRLFDGPVYARELAATTRGTPVVAMPVPGGGLALAVHRNGAWSTRELATPAPAHAVALTPDGACLAALPGDPASPSGGVELVRWELYDGEPVDEWQPVGGFPATWTGRLGGVPYPRPGSRLHWHPHGRLLAVDARNATLLVDVDAAEVLAVARAGDGGVVWEIPGGEQSARLSAVPPGHTVLQTHADARPSQVHDDAARSAYWEQVVDPATVSARLREALPPPPAGPPR